MKRKTVALLLLLTSVALVVIPESLAYPQFLAAYNTTFNTNASCGICHVNPAGGGPRNSYGQLFESQPNHDTDPSTALTNIGPSPNATSGATSTATTTATTTATGTTTVTVTVTVTATGTPYETYTEMPTETETYVTTPVITPTPTTTPGFGFIASLAGLLALGILARRYKK